MIRRAKPEEAPLLSTLALRSKAHWNYDQAFLQACTAELTLTPEEIRTHPTFVIEQNQVIAGFYMLKPYDATSIELDYLYLDPDFIGQGLGKELLYHAIATARDAGNTSLWIQADPHAEAFYRKLGAQTQSYTPSGSIEGRVLPWMRLDFAS